MRRAPVAAAAVFTVVFPLLVLAASPGRLLPFLPRYRYEPLPGDAYGYYACVRQIIATARADAPLALLVAAAAAFAVVAARRHSSPAVAGLVAAWGIGAVVATVAARIPFTGAAQFGWPLVWSIPVFPLRVLGAAGPREGFVAGLALSLAFNAVTVVATYVLARRSGASRHVAQLATGLVAAWPLVSLLTGPDAAANGTWQDWLGLSLYTEPLSTALVVSALAIVVGRRGDGAAVVAGALLGLATLVRLSNLLVVLCVLAYLAYRRLWRPAALTAAAAAAWAPAALLYWPKSYPKLHPPVVPEHPFSIHYLARAWEHSYLWHPAVLLVLVPVAAVGALALRRDAAALLWACVLATAAFYSFYAITDIHPRFLYAIVPLMLLFWAAGAGHLARVVRRWASPSSRAPAG